MPDADQRCLAEALELLDKFVAMARRNLQPGGRRDIVFDALALIEGTAAGAQKFRPAARHARSRRTRAPTYADLMPKPSPPRAGFSGESHRPTMPPAKHHRNVLMMGQLMDWGR